MAHTDSPNLIEQRIAEQLIAAALAAGYTVSVNDDFAGEGEWTVKRSVDATAILAALGTTGGDLLRFRDADGMACVVSLVWGNGADLIHDSSSTPETEALVRAALIGTDNEGLF